MVNSSRGIIHAYAKGKDRAASPDWKKAVELAVKDMQRALEAIRRSA